MKIRTALVALLSCAVLLPLPLFSADAVIGPRIIGGNEAPDNAWPSAVALLRNETGSLFQRQFCGGNLVADRWVITAAHCIYNDNGAVADASSFTVAVGVTDLQQENTATEISVVNVIVHPFYNHSNPYLYGDLALLELAHDSGQPSMAMYEANFGIPSGTSMVVVGWGAVTYSQSGGLSYPTRLNQVTLPLVSRDTCNQPASYGGIVKEGQLCAGLQEGGKDSCSGDSGGPIMMLQNGVYRQVGIVSIGDGCALPDKYGIYTDTAFYRSWITDYLGGVVPPTPESPFEQETRQDAEGTGSANWQLLVLLLSLLATRVYAQKFSRSFVLNQRSRN